MKKINHTITVWYRSKGQKDFEDFKWNSQTVQEAVDACEKSFNDYTAIPFKFICKGIIYEPTCWKIPKKCDEYLLQFQGDKKLAIQQLDFSVKMFEKIGRKTPKKIANNEIKKLMIKNLNRE
jgi:hypothetical protein